MKIKIGEYTRVNNLLSHCILKSITKSENEQTVNDSIKNSEEWINAENKCDTEIDVNLSINGIELDIRYFFEWLNENYKNVPELRFEKPLKSLPEDLEFLKKG